MLTSRRGRRRIQGKGVLRLADRLFHLTRRFFGAVAARVDETELAGLSRYLSPGEQALFRCMTAADQRHSLDLCQRLARDGHVDRDLLASALLHDVGKSIGPLPLPHRVLFSLLRLVSPAAARYLAAADQPPWRRPWYLAAHHATLGADLAERAGSNPVVVQLVRGHEARGGDRRSALLYDYDRTM